MVGLFSSLDRSLFLLSKWRGDIGSHIFLNALEFLLRFVLRGDFNTYFSSVSFSGVYFWRGIWYLTICFKIPCFILWIWWGFKTAFYILNISHKIIYVSIQNWNSFFRKFNELISGIFLIWENKFYNHLNQIIFN